MKKTYAAPRADRMEFNYTDNVVASGTQGCTFQEYIHTYNGCREDPTDNWYIGMVRETGCKKM